MATKRYSLTKIFQKVDGNNKLIHNGTTLYSSIPESDGDIYVITQYGDRLDLLANRFYGDPSLWWYIAKANNLIVMKVPTGTSLRIPANTDFAIGR